MLDVYRSTFKESECIDDMELTVLHEVILEITPGRLSQVIEDNPSQLDLTDAAGNTALNWAALRGDLVSIELLLSCGSDPNVVNLRGESPLASASKFCRADCMKALLDAGADVRPDVDGLTPLHYVCGRTDRVELIQLLLRCDVNLDQQDIFCRSPLAMAVWKNHHRVAELLLSLGADKERKDVFGASPLLRAVQYNAVDAARVLIEYGANTSSTAKDGQTILHRAALSRSESMMKYLANVPLAPIDISVKDGMDMTAKERLMQLKPSMELLQAFTELSLAASRSAEASLLLAEDAPIATYSSISAFRQASDSLVALPFLGNMFTRASAVDESGDGSRLDLPRSDSPFESFEDAVEFQN